MQTIVVTASLLIRMTEVSLPVSQINTSPVNWQNVLYKKRWISNRILIQRTWYFTVTREASTYQKNSQNTANRLDWPKAWVKLAIHMTMHLWNGISYTLKNKLIYQHLLPQWRQTISFCQEFEYVQYNHYGSILIIIIKRLSRLVMMADVSVAKIRSKCYKSAWPQQSPMPSLYWSSLI